MKTTASGQVEETIEVPVWIDEPANAATAEASTIPVTMETYAQPFDNNFETVDEFYERDPESIETPGGGRTQSHYIQQFVDRVHPMLKALLSREALPLNHICRSCDNHKIAIWRCRDCSAARLCCRGCIRRRHTDCPTHRIEVWNGSFFRPAELWEAGLYVVVRHHTDRDVCPALDFQINTLDVFQVQKDDDEEKQLQKGVFVSNKSQMENPLTAEKEPMDDRLEMDIDNDDEFASRLDDMYRRSHDGNQMAGKPTMESNDDTSNDIEEMPPLPQNYIPTIITTAISSQNPDTPRYDALNNPYIRIIHTNGIHHIGVVYCSCRGMDTTHADMMAAGFVPTSFTRYKTFFTHAVLDDFRLSNLECKASAYQYFQKLRRLTSPMSPESVPNLYHELRRMSRLWRWMKKLKWAGMAHRPDFTIDPEPGELANFCPACPQPGINIPENWHLEPER